MPQEYFKERLRAQEEQIASLLVDLDTARSVGNQLLVDDLICKLEIAQRLRETYERMLRETDVTQVAV